MQIMQEFAPLGLLPEVPPLVRLASLRRPRLLMRAAACALGDYRRTGLAKRLGLQGLRGAAAIEKLFALEALSEAARQARSPHYRPARHLELMIALCAEIALLRQSGESPAIHPIP